MADKIPVLYLLDASSYIHRAFHAIRGLTTSGGVPTNAVYGFVQMLLKVMKDAKPSHLAVVYDTKGPTFRHKLYPAYKANRPPLDPALRSQFPLVRQVVTALNLPAVEAEGFEADDLMATLAKKATEQGFAVVLVSGDKDLFQLLNDQVTMWDTMKEVRLGPEEVKEKLGVGPEHIVDLQALWGDSTDNVPGVPGVGKVTAAKLINQHGGLEDVLAAAGGMKKSKMRDNLLANVDKARLSAKLVELSTVAPVEFIPDAYEVRDPDPKVLTPVLAQLEFNRLIKEFAQAGPPPKGDYTLVTDVAELEAYLQKARELGRVAVDTETTSVDSMRAELVGFSLSFESAKGIYVPVGHNLPPEKQADREKALAVLGKILADDKMEKIGQNLKYDLTVLARAGVKCRGPFFDTMVASYVLNPGRNSHSLEAIAAEFLGRSVIPFEEAVGGKDKSFADADLTKAVDYAAEDADVAWQAALEMEPRLEKAGLTGLFRDLEMPLVPLLAKMEMNGVGLNQEGMRELGDELGAKLGEIEQNCYRLAGHEFNLNSPKQLGEVLFEELGLTQVKKTKKRTAYSTDMSVLTILAAQHPLPAEVLNYRTINKLKSTYIDVLPTLIHPETGRIHSSFNQTVAATGRLSSSDPNLQNIPVRTEIGERIRGCFTPDQGNLLISCDYSQIELRVLAHLSRDALLVRDLKEGLDVHTQTAARLFDVMPGLVTKEMRARAKTVNFGLLYGMSAFRLAREQGISRKEAEEIIAKYLGRYEGIARYREEVMASARDKGYVITLMGRRRFLPAINARDRVARQGAERMALNTPIQGTAADIIKLAMLKVDEAVSREFPRAMMTLQVHDELMFEAPEAEAEALGELVRDIMENVIELAVPLTVDMGLGHSWAEAH